MSALASVVTASYLVVSVVLLAVAARAWRHARTGRVALLAAAFAAFVVKGLLLTYGLFTSATWRDDLMVPALGIDLVAFALLYAAILRD